MEALTLFSPAKLNLFFRVLGKTSDGYHQISSLFQTISINDEITIKLSEHDQFVCDDLELLNDDNLVLKARDLFRKTIKKNFCVDISLRKRIPKMSGLGGGSSNAATTLFGLNRLMGNFFEEKKLQELGKEIGSDVSFFFSKGSALCSGRGEIVEDYPINLDLEGWVAMPNFFLKTKDVYAKVDPAVFITNRSWDPVHFLQPLLEKKLPIFFNDLEWAAKDLDKRIKKVKNQLCEMGFDQVVMTGSGSAFFCLGLPKTVINDEKIQFFPFRLLTRNQGKWYDAYNESKKFII